MYEHIRKWADDFECYRDTELESLATIWARRKEELASSGELQEFEKRLQREWAIETGIIERLYSWDRGVTELLIEQGIDASIIAHRGGMERSQAEKARKLINDHLGIVEGLFSFVKQEQPLTEHFIRALQAQFTAHQDHVEAMTPTGEFIEVELRKGEYKSLPNNPRRPDGGFHEYCPPEQVASEMERLVRWFREGEEQLPIELQSAWLHHRFTQIHPFQDGNGRVARTLATLVFLRAQMFPLVIREKDRRQYIEALEQADAGDLHPLTDLVSKRQKDAILRALSLQQQVSRSRHAKEIFSSGIQLLRDKYAESQADHEQVYVVADSLRSMAEKRMSQLADEFTPELRRLTPVGERGFGANAKSVGNDDGRRGYYHRQIIETSKAFDYFANFDRYRSWSRLAIFTETAFETVVSIHGFGKGNSGILVASAFSFERVPPDDDSDGTQIVGSSPCCVDLFQFNYAELEESIKKRYDGWLDASLALGLSNWRDGQGS